MSESQPLFMRLPAVAAQQLDRLARDRGASKREIVTRLILDEDLTVGHHAFHPATEPAVLTPRQAAELLQIDEQLILELAACGQLPARRLGDQWRFSRNALLDWLGSADPADQPQYPQADPVGTVSAGCSLLQEHPARAAAFASKQQRPTRLRERRVVVESLLPTALQAPGGAVGGQ